MQINNLKGAIKTINEYHFDATMKYGELIKNKEINHYKFDFNKEGFVKEWSKFVKHKMYVTQQYEYENGQCITKIEYDSDGSLLSRTEYTYNEQGYCIKEKIVNHDKNSVDNYIYSYNNNGNIAEIKSSNTNYKIEKSFLYKENKLTIKNFLGSQIEYEINNKNEVTKITIKEPVKIFLFKKMFKNEDMTFAYNHNGDLVKDNQKWYDDEDPNYFEEQNCNYVYTYDINNNWIKMDCTIGDEYMIIEREIEYYITK